MTQQRLRRLCRSSGLLSEVQNQIKGRFEGPQISKFGHLPSECDPRFLRNVPMSSVKGISHS